MARSEKITLRNGRRVAVHFVAEGPSDRTVVMCHAAPGSGDFDPDPEATWARGITLIGVDRPGYGGSDPVRGDEWAGVDRAADELAEVIDRLDLGPVGVAGWSAGGRVALALAVRQADLVDRVAVIGTPAPDDEVPWVPAGQRAGLEAMRGLPPDQVHEMLGGQLMSTPPADSSASRTGRSCGTSTSGPVGSPADAVGKVTAMTDAVRLVPGDQAPDFTLSTAGGSELALSSLRGHKVILYAYPAAMTPGCTTQACDFRDSIASLGGAGYRVVGISPDSPAKLAKFVERDMITFPLVSDPDKAVLTAYGAYGEKQLYGKTVTGVIRSTFVIDEQGAIERAFYNVKATGHVAKLRRDLGID